MSGAIILENIIDRDWWHKLDVLANTEKELEPFRTWVPPVEPAQVNICKEAGAWHMRAYWPLRARLDLPVPLGIWPMIAWWIGQGKVSTAMIEGGAAFTSAFGMDAHYAFIQQIPAKAVEFVEVHGITLVRASWVPENFIAVVRGGMQQLSKGG